MSDKTMKKALAVTLIAGLTISSLVVPTAFAAESTNEAVKSESTATADEAVTVEGIEHTFNITEATAVQKQIAKIIKLSDDEKLFYDVNNDGKLNISDVTLIQQFVACVKDTPKYYTIAGYATIEHEAEYETVEHEAEYETVEHEAEYETVTVIDKEAYEKPVYVKSEGVSICHNCDEDITPLLQRYDTAVENGRSTDDLNYVNGHWYSAHSIDAEGNSWEDDFMYHEDEHIKKLQEEYGYDLDDWLSHWTTNGYSSSPYIYFYYGFDEELNLDEYTAYLLTTVMMPVSEDDPEIDYIYVDDSFRVVDIKTTNPCNGRTCSYSVIYKTFPAETHTEQQLVKEAYTEQVLVKEAYTEQVLVKEAYTEQVYVEAGWH